MAKDHLPDLDTPSRGKRRLKNPFGGDSFGRASEGIARFMGTPGFLVGMTIFCALWLGWNTFAPEEAQFDPRALNFTLLTLMLSLQASYAAPLLLLAQNRQDDRDRVQAEQDRQSAERNHATTDFITREIASLRLALNDVATRDFVRGELRDLLEDLQEAEDQAHSVLKKHAQVSDVPEDASTPTPTGLSPETLEALRVVIREEIVAAQHTALAPHDGPRL